MPSNPQNKYNHATGIGVSALLHLSLVAGLIVLGQQGLDTSRVTSPPLAFSMSSFQTATATAPSQAASSPAIASQPQTQTATSAAKAAPAKTRPAQVPQKTQRSAPAPSSQPIEPKPPVTDTAQEKNTPRTLTPEPPMEMAEDETDAEEHVALAGGAPEETTDMESDQAPQANHSLIVSMEAQYMAALRKAIESYKFYPKRERRMRREGAVIVSFLIDRSGMISRVKVAQSSGTQGLDEAARDALLRLQQFKPIPSEIPRDDWQIEIPLEYSIL